MIDIEIVRQLSNPYEPVQDVSISDKQFIGRDSLLILFQDTIAEFNDTQILNNVLLVGPKTIGKSSLIEKYHRIAASSLATCSIELSVTNEQETTDFFIRMFDKIITQFEKTDNFLPPNQISNWNEAIRGDGPTLNYVESFFQLPLILSRSEQTVDQDLLVHDLRILLDKLVESDADVDGIYLFIDEFQEFKKNPHLIELLTRLSSRLPRFGIVGAGREDIYKDSAIFERFVRSAKTNDLPPLDEKKGQIGDAVLMPLVEKLGCMYHEAEQFFESDSLAILEQKTGGNPLHIRLLCSAMFNEFKQDENAEEIKINRAVLEKAMQKYQGWSSNSRQIQTALSTCTSDQLKAFSSLYFYEGLDVRSIIIEKMAFNNITPELEEKCLSNIRSDFDELQGLQLFNITDIDGKPVSISTIDDLTPTKAHNVKFDFIGDEFDRLYASYYYQSITNTDLDLRFSYELVDLLAQKLCNNVALMVVNNEEIEGYDSESPTLNYLNRKTPSSFEEVKDELDEISKKEEQTPEDISNVQTLSKDYNLVFPSRYAQAFNLQGYYVLEIDLIIFGKERNVRCFFPISSEEDKQTIPTRSLERSKYFSASLDEYNIEIRNLKLHWIPNQITILIFCAKTTDYETMLFNFTRDGKFDKATKQAKDLMDYSRTWGRKGKSYVSSKSVNNYAFTLINVGDILEAGKLLEQTHNKVLTSSINLAYVELMNGKYHNARSRLKKIFNKVKELPQLPQGLAFIHLAIMHEGIDHANKMIRDTIEQNICAWNLMLIAADRNERGALDEFKTWPKLKDENEKLIHRRVLYWVENSLGNREKALSAARELFEDLNKESYLHKDVEIDIKVLSELAEDLQDSSEIRVGDKKGDADSAD